MVFGGRPNAGLGHLTHSLRGSTHQSFVDKPYVQSLDQQRQTIVLTGCSIRTFSLLWEIRSMFMQNCFNVSALQHGCRAKPSIAKTNLKIALYINGRVLRPQCGGSGGFQVVVEGENGRNVSGGVCE